MASRRKEVVFQPGFDHPPADESLEAYEACNAEESGSHGCRDFPSCDEIDAREKEGEPDDATPDAVDPFHVVD